MRTNYVLIDYENVQVKSLTLLEGDHFRVNVFLGPTNTKLPIDLVVAIQRFGERAEYTMIEAQGKNALDFHISYYLGKLSATEPTAYFHIISRDTGFDPLILHLKTNGIYSCRSNSIEEMPCFSVKKEVVEENGDKAEDSASDLDKNFRLVHEDLLKRKASKPRRVKTLKSTMQARCGKETPATLVNSIFQRMVSKGFVKVDGEKVSYALPEL